MSNPILPFALDDLYTLRNLTITPGEVSYFAEKKGIELTKNDVIDTMDNLRENFAALIERHIDEVIVVTKDIKQGELYKYIDSKYEILNGHSVLVIESLKDNFYKVKFLTGHAIDRYLEVKSDKLLKIRSGK